MTKPKILIVDDELNLRRVLAAILKRAGYSVRTVGDGAEAMAELKLSPWSVVVTDLKMPRVSGMELLAHVNAHYPDIPVVIITAHGSIGGAVDALKEGAFDYITKPFEHEAILSAVDKAVRMSVLNKTSAHTAITAPDKADGRFGMIGRSPQMKEVFDVLDRVASQPSTVLITGESGTGKELVARALHQYSVRQPRPFIRINCAAIPANLIESELFGYEKGAFTGADHSKPGRMELADGGTLFLDEIGEISLAMQVKLLRALQESEFERVGGVETVSVDVRLVAATNKDLMAATKAGTFREDLFYRLNVIPIRLPALRQRAIDVPPLVAHFVSKYNERLHKSITGVTDDAQEVLAKYPWPGNIRELENVVERTMLFADSDHIDVDDLPPEIRDAAPGTPRTPIPSIHLPATEHGLKEAVRETTRRLECEYITQALDDTDGNVTQAAKRLKISRKSLQNKMKEFGLRDDS